MRDSRLSGNRFVDAVTGLWSASLGFNPPRLASAAADQMNRLAYYHRFVGRACEVTEAYAAKLVRVLPDGIEMHQAREMNLEIVWFEH